MADPKWMGFRKLREALHGMQTATDLLHKGKIDVEITNELEDLLCRVSQVMTKVQDKLTPPGGV